MYSIVVPINLRRSRVERDLKTMDGDYALRLEAFEDLCTDLRRNHQHTTVIPDFDAQIPQYGRRLGEALQENHYVSSIVLDLDNLLAAEEGGTEGLALLLRYIRESEAMRKVTLYCGDLSVLRLFLLAIAENPRIEALALTGTVVPSEAFALFMRTTQSLKTFSITSHDNWTAAQRELVLAEAVGANRTLESLTFEYFSDTATVGCVLVRLGSHPCLRELKLECGQGASVAQIMALAHLLRSTALLEHLELSHYVFDKKRMECLVDGLHSNQSLKKLSLRWCEFDVEATDTFRSFMQTRDSRSSIRELCIGGIDGTFEGSSADTMLASMLTMPDETQDTGSSIGSSLQVLELLASITSPDFCNIDALAANASRIHLPCLRLDNSRSYNNWDTLYSCLPKLVYLKELHLCELNQVSITRKLVDALLRNGSLEHVVIEPGKDDLSTYDLSSEAKSRIIQSYCKRNEAVPILVAKVGLDKVKNVDKTDLSLLPTLFQAAKQAPRTAPNAMLIGLLAAGNLIGPRHRDGKRMRPDESVERAVPP